LSKLEEERKRPLADAERFELTGTTYSNEEIDDIVRNFMEEYSVDENASHAAKKLFLDKLLEFLRNWSQGNVMGDSAWAALFLFALEIILNSWKSRVAREQLWEVVKNFEFTLTMADQISFNLKHDPDNPFVKTTVQVLRWYEDNVLLGANPLDWIRFLFRLPSIEDANLIFNILKPSSFYEAEAKKGNDKFSKRPIEQKIERMNFLSPLAIPAFQEIISKYGVDSKAFRILSQFTFLLHPEIQYEIDQLVANATATEV
jgi:hypothetical protein